MSKHMPTFDSLMNPLLDALFTLGGSGSIDEIYEKVLEQEKIDEEVSSVPHNPEKSNQTEVAYRLAWARTYLKKYGFLENSSRGIWALTKLAKELKHVEPQAVVKEVRDADKGKRGKKGGKKGTLPFIYIITHRVGHAGGIKGKHPLLVHGLNNTV